MGLFGVALDAALGTLGEDVVVSESSNSRNAKKFGSGEPRRYLWLMRRDNICREFRRSRRDLRFLETRRSAVG
jgi:hypothetical protein